MTIQQIVLPSPEPTRPRLHAAVHVAFVRNIGFSVAQQDELRRLLNDRVLVEG